MLSTGTLIKNAMNEAKINQKVLQSITGIDQHILSDYINDKRSPRIDDLKKIASATNKSLAEFIPHTELYIKDNNYHDNSLTIQNYYAFDKNFVFDLIKENLELKQKLTELIKL